MLLILLNWLLIGYITFTIGFATRRLFVATNETCEVSITILWGMFTLSLISTILLFFIPAGSFLLAGFFVLAIVSHVFHRNEIRKSFKLLRLTFVSKWQVFSGLVLLFCLLVFSAQASKINDDGYYYIQTMMWFSEVGFVRGISNLLLPLGLGSSWHVLQAVFSFDFVEGLRFNDLNGLLILIFFVFCVENGFHRKENALLALLMAVTVGISVPFLSAPSPDLPVIVLTVIGFYLVFRELNTRTLTDVLVLAAFAVSIKMSAVALALLGIVLVLYAVKNDIKIRAATFVVLVLCGGTLIAKNIYLTGYPLYPYAWLGFPQFSWSTPVELLQYYTAGLKYWGLEQKIYTGPMSEWHNPGIAETVELLWERTGYKGLINKFVLVTFPLILLTMVRTAYKSWRTETKSLLPMAHGIFILNVFVWLILAPQFRFILPVYIFYFTWCVWWWLNPFIERFGTGLQVFPYISIASLFLLSIYPLKLEVKSTSTHIGQVDPFSFETAVRPHVSYSFPGVDTLVVGGTEYYHVEGSGYCWDGPLPCMSVYYHEFLHDLGYMLDRRGRASLFWRIDKNGWAYHTPAFQASGFTSIVITGLRSLASSPCADVLRPFRG